MFSQWDFSRVKMRAASKEVSDGSYRAGSIYVRMSVCGMCADVCVRVSAGRDMQLR